MKTIKKILLVTASVFAVLTTLVVLEAMIPEAAPSVMTAQTKPLEIVTSEEVETALNEWRVDHDLPTFKTDNPRYRDWETDRKSTRLNSSHSAKSRMPSSA